MQLYDRLAVGERIRKQRILIGLTQEELAEKVGRAYKYCQDIERGTCGMSIETMLNLSASLNLSLDYMIYGINKEDIEPEELALEQQTIINILGKCSDHKRKYALDLLKLFMKACDDR